MVGSVTRMSQLWTNKCKCLPREYLDIGLGFHHTRCPVPDMLMKHVVVGFVLGVINQLLSIGLPDVAIVLSTTVYSRTKSNHEPFLWRNWINFGFNAPGPKHLFGCLFAGACGPHRFILLGLAQGLPLHARTDLHCAPRTYIALQSRKQATTYSVDLIKQQHRPYTNAALVFLG